MVLVTIEGEARNIATGLKILPSGLVVGEIGGGKVGERVIFEQKYRIAARYLAWEVLEDYVDGSRRCCGGQHEGEERQNARER